MEGKPQWEIALIVGVGQATVHKDLLKVRDEWMAMALVDFDEARARELAKIDHLEAVCWEAWAKSCEDAEIRNRKREFVRMELPAQKGKKARHKLIPLKVVEEKTSKGRTGDPRFMDRISWCIETRLKLLGLLKDKKEVKVTFDWDTYTEALDKAKVLDNEIAEVEAKALPAPTTDIQEPAESEIELVGQFPNPWTASSN
jgi:hypothetical protein